MTEPTELMTIDEYAIDLAADAILSTAQDDLNENGDIADEDHDAACELAEQIAYAIRNHADEVLAWAKTAQS